MSLYNMVKTFIENNKLFEKSDNIVVALSGGVDSSVLIDILTNIGYRCIIAHINHHKRIESEDEERAIKEYAKNKNIPCEVLEYYHKGNTNFHEDAHNARYTFYKSVCDKYNTNIIATAHHLDDNLETILMNLMSGSNLYGYSGISPIIIENKYKIVRPLLCCSKDCIIKYSIENKIIYYEDSSNNENNYKRNRIRHNIIPLLKKESPDILSKSFEFSEILRNSFNLIRNKSINYVNQYQNKIDIPSYRLLDYAIRLDIICYLLEKYNINKNNEIIKTIDSVLINSSPQKDVILSNDYVFKKRYTIGYIEKAKEKKEFCIKMNYGDKVVIPTKYHIYFTKNVSNINAKYIKLCYNKLAFPLTIRNRKNEDAILMPFGHKKIKDLFIDMKIPKEQRDEIPLVIDSKERVLWLVGLAKSQFVLEQKLDGDIFLVFEEM